MWRKKIFPVFILGIAFTQLFILLIHDRQIRHVGNQVQRVTLSRDAFVQIDVDVNIGMEVPIIYKGSGTLIGKINNRNYALTANHLCNPTLPQFLTQEYKVHVKTVFITDFSGEVYMGNVVFNSPTNDLCIVEFLGTTNGIPAPIAEEPVFINEKVYVFAAPTGFFSPHVVPLFDGYYAGDIIDHDGESSVYTMSAVGGSSGGAILNGDGEIIGIIHSSLVDFHHITLATTHANLVVMLEEYAVLSGVEILVP